ncbi:MAG: OmpA family protein [Byssovorax sp.]
MGAEVRVKGRSRRTGARALAAGVVALAALAVSPRAEAQTRTFYLDRLQIAGAPDDGVTLWRPEMAEKTRFYGQLALGFGFEPFRVENHIEDPKIRYAFQTPVKAQLITYADVGVELLHRFAFQVEMPVALFQTGNPNSTVPLEKSTQKAEVKTASPMDMRLNARVNVLPTPSDSFKLALEGSVWLPTGNPDSFDGDGSAVGGLALAAEYDIKKAFFLANTGFQFRPNSALNDFSVKNEWRYSVGAFLPLRDGSFRLGAQIFGSVGFGQSGTYGAPLIPVEWMGEGRFAFGEKKRGWFLFGGGSRLSAGYAPDFRVLVAAGYSFGIADTNPTSPGKRFQIERFAEHGADTDRDGLPDDIDLCPTEPEDHKPPNPDDGCPSPPDRDGDGIPDNVDKCPDQPEDFDGVQDDDGCPEDDADKDGVPDATDACPKEPGEASPEAEKNGCPQFIRRVTASNEIQILKQVQFATGKSTILSNSFPILDEVVRLLKVNPDINHLDIEGHTDNRGSDDLNEKLSNDRAHAVMNYLVDHGINADRLGFAGYGPKRPIADNATAEGRQKNRRVEFHIRNVEEAPKPSSAPKNDAPAPSIDE